MLNNYLPNTVTESPDTENPVCSTAATCKLDTYKDYKWGVGWVWKGGEARRCVIK